MKKELKDFTNDKLNDACVTFLPDVNIKPRFNKAKIISLIKKELKKKKILEETFINDIQHAKTVTFDKDEIVQEVIKELKTEDEAKPVPFQQLYKPVKCHRCQTAMEIVDKVNMDFLCPKCGGKTTLMVIY